MEKLIVTEENSKVRLDQFVMKACDISRSKVQKMIEQELIKVNDKLEKNSYRVKVGDNIEVGEYVPEEMNLEPVNMNLKIVYEDDDVIVVDKENGTTSCNATIYITFNRK